MFSLSIPLAFYTGKFFLASDFYEYGLDYFFWTMLFIPFFPMAGAVNGFFIGRGKVILVTIISVIANMINFGLNIILVFGAKGLVPEMGVIGAAIATHISELIAFITIFIMFLLPRHQRLFHTNHFKINLKLLIEGIK